MRKIIVFMRGKYCLEEIGNSKDELTFLTIFGKKDGECFEIQNSRFSKYVHDNHDNSKTYHDGKWMFVDGNTLEQLEEVKKLTRIRKKPGRKPFPKEKAIYSQSGQRCDFCVDYVHTSEEQRTTMENPSSKIRKKTDWRMRCEGCYSDNCHCKDEPCGAKEYSPKKELAECRACVGFPCVKAASADDRSMIHTEVHYVDERS